MSIGDRVRLWLISYAIRVMEFRLARLYKIYDELPNTLEEQRQKLTEARKVRERFLRAVK
jgi:hypothetical protein